MCVFSVTFAIPYSHTGRPPLRGPRTFCATLISPSPKMFWHLRSSNDLVRRLTVFVSAARRHSRGYGMEKEEIQVAEREVRRRKQIARRCLGLHLDSQHQLTS